jgi:hypothetical protein
MSPKPQNKFIERVLAGAGVPLVLAAVLVPIGTNMRLVLALAGIIMLQSHRLPSPARRREVRRFSTLRTEVNDFIHAVRRVNGAAGELSRKETTESRQAFERGCEELVARAEHIGMLTWRTNAELAEGRKTDDPEGASTL